VKAVRLLLVTAILAVAAIVAILRLRREPVPDVAPPVASPHAAAPAAPDEPTSPRSSTPPAASPSRVPAAGVERDVLKGTVRAPDGTPVPGARVNVRTEQGEIVRQLGAPPIDAGGRFELDVSALGELPPATLATTTLIVRATAPVHRGGDASLPAARPQNAAERNVTLVLVPGGVLRGRVVGSSGEPVTASVSARREPSLEDAGSSATEADGSFEIPIAAAGPHSLLALANGIGTAVVRSIPLDPVADTDLGDVRLHGPGTIEGFVRHGSGRPAPNVVVVTERTPPAQGGDGLRIEENGLQSCSTESDDEGRFRCAGLAPGRFVVRAQLDFESDAEAPRVEAETGDGNVTLVIDVHRLTIRVKNEKGEPVPGAEFEFRESKNDEERMSSGGYLAGADASETFVVDPGAQVYARASAGPLEAEATRTIAEEDEDVVLDLVLAPPREREKGRLRVEIVDANGERVPRFTATLRAIPSNSAAFFEAKPDDEGRLPLVPAGDYRLDVCPGRENFMRSFETFFPVENERVHVGAGAETTVSLRARAGGRVQLTVACATTDVHPRVSLRRDAASEAVQLGLFAWSTGDGTSSSTAPRIGGPNVCAPVLEPGNWTLRVEADGFRTVEVPVAIDAGKLADVSVELRPAS
jgi:hypothetical protein